MSPGPAASSRPQAPSRYVEVAVAAGPVLPRRAGTGLPGVYSYHVADDQPLEVGTLVEVPFGPRLLPGLVAGRPLREPDVPTRPIARRLGDRPLISPLALELARFVAVTYRAPLFECLALMLPPGFANRLKQAQRDGAWSPPRFKSAPPTAAETAEPEAPPDLTDEQRAACDAILAALTADRPSPFLLYGPTGSGKTLVYLEAVARVVDAGRQAIVLASEIGLTPELIARFQRRFPGRIAVLHSQLSHAQRYRNWQSVADGEARVVIGSRSALFAPAGQLGLVVLDEEHEWSYKQHEGSPRYHARDVALELGRLARVPVVLSSATPDVVTAWRAESGELRRLGLSGRYGGEAAGGARQSSLPPVQVVDLRSELQAGNVSIFSRALRTALAATLERDEQAILFINRRGAATCVTCRHCGHVVSCRRCEIPLVYHRAGEALVCHRCNQRRPMVERCPGCGGSAIRHFGVGTQRVEQELTALFPGVRAVRWDRDSGQARGAHTDLWERFRRQEADVLVGTQMVAKALDFPLVTVVGVVLADVGLYLPDFRGAERSFQLLTQVAGRAGRGERPGRVIVQTYSPTHYAIRHAAHHDYDGFYAREIEFRRLQGYPPFGRLVRFVYADPNDQRCWRESGKLRRLLQDRIDLLADPELRLMGPAPCYAERVRGRYRWQIVVRGERLDALLDGLVLPPGWILDVDPVSLL